MADTLATFIEAASSGRLVQFRYLKYPKSTNNPWRLAEPYSMSDGKQDLLLYTFQVDPTPDGYRSFMLHKIADASVTDTMYIPRRTVTIDGAVVQPSRAVPEPAWTDAARAYRDQITIAMADGEVTVDDQHACLLLAREVGLSTEERDYVHASLFHRILGAALDDGRLTDDERKQFRFMHRTLASLGYAPGA